MIPAALLPPVQQPPHDPRTLILTGAESLSSGTLNDLHIDPRTNRVVLDQALSIRRILTELSGTFGGIVLPTNVAIAADGGIYLLDRSTLTLKRFDPCECRFQPIPCLGGEGSGPRQLRNPFGIGICAGKLFICDTGIESNPTSCGDPHAPERIRQENHRVMVLSLNSLVLEGYWNPPPSAYEGTEPKLLIRPWQPVDIDFDGQGRVYVSDPANECIHQFNPRGVWLGRFADLGSVTHIAIDCHDRIYASIGGKPLIKVVDIATQMVQEIETGEALQGEGAPKTLGADDSVATGPENKRKWPENIAKFFPCLPFPIDRVGRLHLGRFCTAPHPNPSNCQTDRDEMEPGVFDLNGSPVSVSKNSGKVLFVNNGSLITRALDSELYRCVWHRVLLFGDIPQGASLEVETFTSEVAIPDAEVQTIFLQRQMTTSVMPHDVRNGMADVLVRSPAGRYLWIKLNFQGNGQATPSLSDIEVEFPRISLRRYLPAVFGEEPVSADFTDRFLGIVDTTIRSVETTLDNLARYFDPMSAPSERRAGRMDFLSWLASWVGISFDKQWPEDKRRRFLKQAGKLFSQRGTVEGLRKQLFIYLGIEPERLCCVNDRRKKACTLPPCNCRPTEQQPCFWQPPLLILEHFRLRRWLFLGQGRLHDRAVLWGRKIVNRTQLGNQHAQVGETQLIMRQDPLRDPFHVHAHQFTVFVPAKWKRSDSARKGLENLLKSETPAHTKYTVTYVEPHFRLGVQSMVGFDTAIGRYPQGVVLDDARLGQGTVLTAPPSGGGGMGMRVGKDVRIGATTQLRS